MIKLSNVIYVFLMSMLPLVELRGSIILGAGLDLPWWLCFVVSVVGNLLPIPFILLFIKKILEWMKGVHRFKFDKIALWLEEKAEKNSHKVLKYATWGLFLFVAIPLPGTGAWTGALVASLFEIKMKNAIIAITLGVLTAGVIMTCASYGVFGFLSFLVG